MTYFTFHQSLRNKGMAWTGRIIAGVHRTYFTIHQFLRDKRKGWTSRTDSIKGVHKKSFTVQLSLSYIGTNGRDGQEGLIAVLKESIGHPLLSIIFLGTKVIAWTSRTGSIKDVYRTYFTFHQSFIDKGKVWTSRTKGNVNGVHRTYFTFDQSLSYKSVLMDKQDWLD